MLAQSASRSQHNDSNSWAKPHSVLENLQGSVDKLSHTLNALQGSVELLQPSTKDFTRLKQVMQFQRQYDLVSEKDIKAAQSQIAQDIRPQIDKLLSDAEGAMTKLMSEERELEATVEKQEEELKVQQSKYTGSQRHGMLHDRMKQGDQDKSDPDAIESMRRIKNLKLKKDSLIRSIEDRSEEIERKEHQLRKLQGDSVRMQQIKQSTTMEGTAQESPLQQRKRQLMAELATIELKLSQKQKAIKSQRPNHSSTMVDVSKDQKPSRRRKFMEADMDGSLGNDEPHWMFYPQHLRFIQGVLERICDSSYRGDPRILKELESQGRKYLQQIQKARTTISTVSQTDRKQWKRHSVKQMKVMCKILFPDGTVGTTMGRIIEMLFCDDSTKKDGSSQKSQDDEMMIDILERGVPVKVLAREFPPAQERRHNLQKAIQILSDIGVIETLQEVDDDHDESAPGEMIIRVKGVESILQE
ncbi:hypothetical protein INT43_008861 [Umbelopsis isabellina]|uniref:DASH complex subunit SPC19 n=1 Tax=Mortierella isabellina TaxID=91625 RepID=A0A8H7PW11_MORIS|nr:hypothetical protein INT43_008861 [Umbelopsis isabellina]